MANNELTAYLEAPERVSELSRAQLGELLSQTKSLEGAIFARLLTDDHAGSGDESVREDKLLTVDETAAMLGVTKGWVYRRGAKLGLAVKLGDGTLRFSRNTIQQYILESAVKRPHARSGKKAA